VIPHFLPWFLTFQLRGFPAMLLEAREFLSSPPESILTLLQFGIASLAYRRSLRLTYLAVELLRAHALRFVTCNLSASIQ